ncbi:MAG: Gfo/Idh/MocA family oxidoreductase [Planctomycetes bacterium]|nr:Gfo/Idh/MocA family oxidoreductase [Planctomycetota bacterium]
MSGLSRRAFLRRSAAFAGASFAIGVAGRPVLGANDRINVGVAGIHGRGGGHIGSYRGMKDAAVTYLIDVDSTLFKPNLGAFESALAADLMKQKGVKEIQVPKEVKGDERKKLEADRAAQLAEFRKQVDPARLPKCVQDVRKALEDKELNAISIATPNHWHSLMSIWAVQAGKDVYVEKPLSHNVWEGRKLVEAARKYKCMVQHGSQSRGEAGWARATALARSGKLGKLLVSYGWASKPRGPVKASPPEPPPATLDYNIWLGPAPHRPFSKTFVHYNWHWFWDFGNGEIGNQGVHQMDLARWALPEDALTKPIKVLTMGGRFGWDDPCETPNAHLTVFDYGDYQLVYEACNLTRGADEKKGIPNTAIVSNAFVTEKGEITPGGFTPKDGKREPLPAVEINMGAGGGSFDNFVRAMRSRKHEDLVADVLQGHLSCVLCHLGNVAYRLGKPVPFAESRKVFAGNDAAMAALEKMEWRMKYRDIKIDDSLNYCVGPVLTFDQKEEKFVGERADEANKLLTRAYRAPFVVPEQV